MGGVIAIALLAWWCMYRALVKSQAFLKFADQAFIGEIEDEKDDSNWDVFYADVSDPDDD
ncbi:MAG: hypothetical protein ACXAEI_17165 [Candidatus Hodarchaeales archaeon]|jgi:hypothetical protein